jgi:hypothetical protein
MATYTGPDDVPRVIFNEEWAHHSFAVRDLDQPMDKLPVYTVRRNLLLWQRCKSRPS